MRHLLHFYTPLRISSANKIIDFGHHLPSLVLALLTSKVHWNIARIYEKSYLRIILWRIWNKVPLKIMTCSCFQTILFHKTNNIFYLHKIISIII